MGVDMSKFGLSRWVVLLAVILFLAQQARVQPKLDVMSTAAKGAVILYTVPPHTVCVGDTFMVEGGGFILPVQAPAGKPVIHLAISSTLGTATPDEFVQVGNEVYFRFAYTASRGGDETIKAVENNALAMDVLEFKVDKSCAFGASLTSIVRPRRSM
jgi:hypothetical protein